MRKTEQSDRLPRCPTCGATGERCKRPSGHEAAQWHREREDAMARQCGCESCLEWLRGGRVARAADQLELEVVE